MLNCAKAFGVLLPVTMTALTLLVLLSCVVGKVERPTYELGETGMLIVRNPSRFPMAIGGCNPTFYQERMPGRWVPDPLLRPACVFAAS